MFDPTKPVRTRDGRKARIICDDMKDIKGNITITRPQCGNGDEYILIKLKDCDAVLNILEIKMSYSDFTKAITGLSSVECSFTARKLENVGKKRVMEEIVFEFKDDNYEGRKERAYDLAREIAGPEWEVDSYFGSQKSFFTKNGIEMARTNIKKWVDKD